MPKEIMVRHSRERGMQAMSVEQFRATDGHKRNWGIHWHLYRQVTDGSEALQHDNLSPEAQAYRDRSKGA